MLMTDVNAKLVERKLAIETEFQALADKEKSLVEQGRELNRLLGEIRKRQVQLQGAFSEIQALTGDSKPIPVEEVKKKK